MNHNLPPPNQAGQQTIDPFRTKLKPKPQFSRGRKAKRRAFGKGKVLPKGVQPMSPEEVNEPAGPEEQD
jgi:hypothetical protein